MGGIKTFIGEGAYQGKGDMSDGNVWGAGGGVFGVAYDMAYIPIYQA